MYAQLLCPSPVGPLRLISDGQALSHCLFDGDPPPAALGPLADGADVPLLREAARQLGDYFAGRRRDFDLPLAPSGTPFQRAVWAALRQIPYGATRSYAEVAQQIGRPKACRAVGLANGRNPLSIVIPCHRVIGASGALVGYGGGLARKTLLLDLERGDAARVARNSMDIDVRDEPRMTRL